MATWQKEISWISAEDFKENPISANITAVGRDKGQYGDVCTITLRIRQGLADEDTKRFSVYKKNLNWLIDHFGEDDSKWIGRTITIKSSNPSGSKIVKELI